MSKRPFFLRGIFWLTFFWILMLLFLSAMTVVQIPEIRYDFGPKQPVEISGPEELRRDRFSRTTFVSISGTPNFDLAFIYQRYGLNYTYFIIEPYGLNLVARTYEKVEDEWKELTQFVGKLRPFRRQPFSYRIRQIFRDRFDSEIPSGAFFLALYDVPKPSAWQIGALIFSVLLGIGSFPLYFFFRRRIKSGTGSLQKDQKHPAGDSP